MLEMFQIATKKGLLSGHVPPQSITCGCLWCDLTSRQEKLERLSSSQNPHLLLEMFLIRSIGWWSVLWDKGKRLPGGRTRRCADFPGKASTWWRRPPTVWFSALLTFPPDLFWPHNKLEKSSSHIGGEYQSDLIYLDKGREEGMSLCSFVFISTDRQNDRKTKSPCCEAWLVKMGI